MNEKEKMFLLKFLYDSSKNANVLGKVFQETLLQDENVKKLKESIEKDYFLGNKGKELKEKGVDIYNDIMSSPASVYELANKVNTYLEKKDMEKLSIDRFAEKLMWNIDEYSVINFKDKEVLEHYFKDKYKAMLYLAVVFGGRKVLENVKRVNTTDLYNWFRYFQYNKLEYESSASDTWVIYSHNYSNYPAAACLSCYELVYYKGPAKFHNLTKETGVIQYTPWIWGDISEKKENKKNILCFGIGNITNITIDNVESIFEKKIWFDLPQNGIYRGGVSTNPILNINHYLGNKGELFCITPLQCVSLCNAFSNYYQRRSRREAGTICPICNTILRDGNKICPRHCDRI